MPFFLRIFTWFKFPLTKHADAEEKFLRSARSRQYRKGKIRTLKCVGTSVTQITAGILRVLVISSGLASKQTAGDSQSIR